MTSSNTYTERLGRYCLAIAAAAACFLASSCGGGGGGASGTNLSNAPTPVAITCNNGGVPAASLISAGTGQFASQIAACEKGLPTLLVPTTGNCVPVILDAGPCAYSVPLGSPSGTQPTVHVVNSANVPYTAVTICAPGSTTACQTIDHILVDTGSTGLRIMASVLTSSIQLPGISDSTGAPLIECVQFADGYSWGSIRTADVRLAGQVAQGIPVQIVGDSTAYTAPSTCYNSTPTPLNALNDVASFGANGVLGVGLFKQDCGPNCVGNTTTQFFYYTCPTTTTCSSFGPALNQQITNPVAAFASNNNGVLLQFSAVPVTSGALNLLGTLTFGINTQTNNQATASTLNTYFADPQSGDFISTLLSSTGGYSVPTAPFANSFIDSGSNAIYFPNTGTGTVIPTDTTYLWFLPSVPNGSPVDVINITATQQSYNSGTAGPHSFSFPIANANTVLFPSGGGNNTVFNGLGAPSSGTGTTGGVDWGLPFFLGKSVFVGIESNTTSVAGTPRTGPFWAY